LIRLCAEHAPVAWTLHDMWSFTGRCAYSYGSRKFITGCDATCANPHEYPALAPERIAGAWEQRRQLFAELSNLVAITPSRWLAEQAKAGLWTGHRVEVIPYGLSLATYRPHDRATAREALGIRAAGPCILIAAHGLQDRRKGVALLLEALPHLTQRPLTLLTMGGGETPFQAEGVHHHALGYLSDEQAKVLAYCAADVLVHPALADNLPLVVMEAIACGRPAVAFPIGGLPEMVRPGETGWLAAEVSAGALADTLNVALRELASGANLRNRCRSFAEQEYRAEQQAQRYLAIFESLMESSRIAVGQEL
jgi:glycosyltransferase involved in cell wall biosynthesis